jgi:PAS domain S-box-containing protein
VTLNRKVVLIVDDEPMSVKILCHQLENEYTVMMAEGGREALEIVSHTTPDIILLDLIMPEMDGYEVYTAIREIPALDGVPVLFITILSNVECETIGLEMGGDDYVHKPFVADLVRLRIKNHLAVSQQRSLLMQRSEELQAVSESYRRLFTDNHAMMLQIDPDNGTIVDANAAALAFYGYTREQLLLMNISQINILPAPDVARYMNSVTLEQGQHFEFRHRRSDGSIRDVDVSSSKIKFGQREILHSILFDITERKQAAEERQRLEQQFQHAQKLESLGVLAGGVAHDFNNILTVIIGHCFLARENLIPEEDYKATFQKVEAAALRAADLCRQMLAYAGKSPLVQARVNLWLLVDEVVKMLHAALKSNVTIELDLGKDIPEIIGDSSQIQQIIMNLFINAAEAIGDAAGTIRVALTRTIVAPDQMETDSFGTAIPPGMYSTLEVADNGCGMDDETQKRIFEPFFTTKCTGRGLGMSAICGIIKSHQGVMSLVSTVGVGTTFTVSFPVNAASVETAPATSDTSAFAPFEMSGNTVLLVDDEETLRNMGEALLGVLGFSTMTAANGCEALAVYQERSSEIDVVLLDMVMPVMDGIEAYHQLRMIAPDLPIIICSGYDAQAVEEIIKGDPCAGFAHKPYKPEALGAMITKMIGPS